MTVYTLGENDNIKIYGWDFYTDGITITPEGTYLDND